MSRMLPWIGILCAGLLGGTSAFAMPQADSQTILWSYMVGEFDKPHILAAFSHSSSDALAALTKHGGHRVVGLRELMEESSSRPEGDSRGQILAFAKEHDVDLVVFGDVEQRARGRWTVTWTLFSSADGQLMQSERGTLHPDEVKTQMSSLIEPHVALWGHVRVHDPRGTTDFSLDDGLLQRAPWEGRLRAGAHRLLSGEREMAFHLLAGEDLDLSLDTLYRVVDNATPPEGMVLVQGAQVEVGCEGGEPGCPATHPTALRGVDAFFLDREEVSVAAYHTCVSRNLCMPISVDSRIHRYAESQCNSRSRSRSRHPMNCVTHAQADAYCRSKGRRLPTEIEWERAVRGTMGHTYPWGAEAPDCARAHLANHNGLGCGTGHTAPTDSMPEGRSLEGALHLVGNVAEWVTSDGGIVAKGGFYGSRATDMQPWRRFSAASDAAFKSDEAPYLFGFRCASGVD